MLNRLVNQTNRGKTGCINGFLFNIVLSASMDFPTIIPFSDLFNFLTLIIVCCCLCWKNFHRFVNIFNRINRTVACITTGLNFNKAVNITNILLHDVAASLFLFNSLLVVFICYANTTVIHK